MDEEYFVCSLNSRARLVSIVVLDIAITVAVIPPLVIYFTLKGSEVSPATMNTVLGSTAVTTGFLAVLLAFVASFAPKGYRVKSTGIEVVRRSGRAFLIPEGDLGQAEAVGPETLKWTIRTCGGSFFGNWGWFRCSALGSFRGYWTNNDNLVVVRSVRGRPIVFSPDARDAFIERVNRAFGVSR